LFFPKVYFQEVVMAYPGKHLQKGEVVHILLEKAELQGYLTTEDITETFSVGDEDEEKLAEIILYLRHQGVDIADDGLDINYSSYDPASLDRDTSNVLENISSDDSVGLYLKEMSRVPLLCVEEELSLAKRIERGKKAKKELSKLNGSGTVSARSELEERIQDGLLARDHLIRANTRLVVSIAKKYMGRGVPFLDLIQEGNLGLMKSVEKYDYHRGFRFSTYATWWIRQTITRAIADQGRTIRVPVHMTDRIRQMYKSAHELEQRLGRPATTEELADEMKLDPRRVHWMLQVSWTPLSLESPVGDEEDSEFGMFVEDEVTPTPAQTTQDNMLRERVEQVLATLSPREARIIRLRFGLDNDRPYTLEEVGQKFGLTRERIRQIEGKALRRLRHPCRSRLLKDYVDPSGPTSFRIPGERTIPPDRS
jgi:RNA polymerase primary sigma factor